jgi:hypothetical protein
MELENGRPHRPKPETGSALTLARFRFKLFKKQEIIRAPPPRFFLHVLAWR